MKHFFAILIIVLSVRTFAEGDSFVDKVKSFFGSKAQIKTGTSEKAATLSRTDAYPDTDLNFLTPKELSLVKRQREVLEKNQKCIVAVNDFSVTNNYHIMSNEMTCIQDITVAAGTMNEKSGCALTVYNLDHGEYTPYNTPIPISEKKCNEGGFEALMQINGVRDQNGKVGTAQAAVFDPQNSDGTGSSHSILVYASDPKYFDWFAKHKR